MSSVAVLQPELRAKTDSTSQDDSNDKNSFADIARVADRAQTSGCNRRTRLIILHRCLCDQLCSFPRARVQYRKPTVPLEMTRAIRIAFQT
eukprot:6403700-Pyramimonas_sp.AAC.1